MPGSITSSTITSNGEDRAMSKPCVAVARQHHLMAFFAQGSLQQFGHPPLVFDYQNLHPP